MERKLFQHLYLISTSIESRRLKLVKGKPLIATIFKLTEFLKESE